MVKTYEHLRRVQVGPFTVRLWIAGWEPDLSESVLNRAIEAVGGCDRTETACERVGRIGGVNAVEVLDSSGNGALLYPEWP